MMLSPSVVVLQYWKINTISIVYFPPFRASSNDVIIERGSATMPKNNL